MKHGVPAKEAPSHKPLTQFQIKKALRHHEKRKRRNKFVKKKKFFVDSDFDFLSSDYSDDTRCYLKA